MYELLDAAGATLCDPLLIILLAVMMMPSGGSSYVFSGKTDDVGFLLLKAHQDSGTARRTGSRKKSYQFRKAPPSRCGSSLVGDVAATGLRSEDKGG